MVAALGLLAFQSSAFAELHFVARGVNSSADVAPIYSCLAYQGCEITTFLLGDQNRLHIYTTKNFETVMKNITRCDFSSVKLKSFGYLTPDGSRYTPFSLPSMPKNSLDLSPAIFGAERAKSLSGLMRKMTNADTLLNVDTVLNGLKIRSYNYIADIRNMVSDVAATTNHEKQTVFLNTGLVKHDIPRVVRHEYDHIFQVKLSDQCPFGSTFSDHNRRERAAYLNDAHFDKRSESTVFKKILEYQSD